jgi:hypothetical protein
LCVQVFVAHLALIPITGALMSARGQLLAKPAADVCLRALCIRPGTSINPARSLGPAVAHGTWYKHWIFWLGAHAGAPLSISQLQMQATAHHLTDCNAAGPLTGAAFAAVVYECTLKGHTRAEVAIQPKPERKPAAVETAAGAAPPPPSMRREE